MTNNSESFRPRGFDKPMFFTAIVLTIIGIIMVFSTTAVLAGEKYNQSTYFLIQQAVGVVLGIILVVCLLRMRKPIYQNRILVYGLLLITFFLLILCFGMKAFAGTNRWIVLFGVRFQPSELAKISLILFFAYYLDKKKDKLHEIQTLLFPLIVLFSFILLIIKEPDYGTAILIFLISVIILFIGGVRILHFVYLGFFSLGLFLFLLLQASYTIDRITAVLWPDKDPLGNSFQLIQSQLAVGSGGLLGVSLGESTQKLYFLPCAHTDFIFAIIGEELGLIGNLTILLLFLILLWRGLVIAKKAPNLASQIAAAGLTLAICFQALLNITIVLGLGPTTGFPLPFLSYGRSSLICSFLALGIILNISQRRSSYRGEK